MMIDVGSSDIRSTNPSSPMNLHLRIETAIGSRTLIVPNIPLRDASHIADALCEAGHYAEFVDAHPAKPIAEMVKPRVAAPMLNVTPMKRGQRHDRGR